jgi:iron complex outermembrane receptor protein
MKNRNLFLAVFLAVPFLLISDNVIEIEEDEEVVAEEVVAEEVVADEEVASSSEPLTTSTDDVEEVVVTGSRIKKSTFTSISPLQIISAETSREIGLIDATSILQEAPASSGQQIDLSFAGFSIDNGPATTQANLRGLGASRTLVLINGRRVGPAGMEGAPYAPDISLLPSSVIQRYEVLLDGASSVYGSDAIAGVSNAVLRKDFEGLTFEVFGNDNEHQPGLGDDFTASITYGLNFDKGFIGLAAEYVDQKMVRYSDRPWTSDCTVDYEITEDGQYRTKNVYYNATNQDVIMDCAYEMGAGYVFTNENYGPFYMNYLEGYDINDYLPMSNAADPCSVPGNGFDFLQVYEYFMGTGGFPGCFAGFDDPDAAGWVAQSQMAVGIDLDGDGFVDVSKDVFNTNGQDRFSSLYPDYNKKSFMAYGDFALDDPNNTTIFFELQHAEKETYSINGGAQLYPWVPKSHDSNIFNPDNEVGFDAGLMGAAIHYNQNFIDDANALYNEFYNETVQEYFANFGLSSPYGGWFGNYDVGSAFCGHTAGGGGFVLSNLERCYAPSGALDVQPTVAVMGDRTQVATTIEQTRMVVGASGDLDINFGSLSDFTYEISHVRTDSTGTSSRDGIRADRLSFGLGWDPTAKYGLNPELETNDGVAYVPLATLLPGGACDPTGSVGEISTDVSEGCVSINLFAPSLYNGILGDFATQAERDYLFDNRTFRTDIVQDVTSAFVSGYLGELPAGDIGFVFGLEKNKMDLESIPDKVADEGLLFGYEADGGARGTSIMKEAFAEIGLPLLAGVRFAEELTAEVSMRHTETTSYNKWTEVEQVAHGKTFAVKMSYRPVSDLLIRATKGTSFRAPNLRETALRAEESFISTTDYCISPSRAWRLSEDLSSYNYDRSFDYRDDIVLGNCEAQGVDPQSLGNTFADGGVSYIPQRISVTSITGGATGLDSETSDSITWGFVYDIPYTSLFKGSDGSTSTSIGVTRYDILIENSIVELSPGYIIYDCYFAKANLQSTFCNNITRNTETGYLETVTGGFVNRDQEAANGVDVNILHEYSFQFGNLYVDAGLDIVANFPKERSLLYVTDDGRIDYTDYVGEPGYPKKYIQARQFYRTGDWTLSFASTFIDDVAQNKDQLDDWGNAFGLENDDGRFIESDTCLGPVRGDVNCRDVGFIKNYIVHTASAYLRKDNMILGFGIRNLFDKEPPMVDGSEISSKSNVPLGYGYNINGRNFFMNVQYTF